MCFIKTRESKILVAKRDIQVYKQVFMLIIQALYPFIIPILNILQLK